MHYFTNIVFVLSLFLTCHRVCNNSNQTGATNGTETVYPFGAHEFILDF